jgi:hypothetical protein
VRGISRIRLGPPNIVEALLGGRTEQVPMLERLERSLPASWEEQRDMIVND